MASFGQLKLTSRGIQAQLNAQSGNVPLKFTRIGMGSGVFTGDATSLTTLVKEEVQLAIDRSYVQDNVVFVMGIFANENLASSFIWREIGLYFEDESGNSVLYCYANAKDKYDVIPATADERYTKTVRIGTAFSNAENVTIQVGSGVNMVETGPYEEWQAEVARKHTGYDAHVASKANPHGVTADQINAMSQMATYYVPDSAMSADNLLDSLALIPVNTTVNAQLYSILSGTFAYVMTFFYQEKAVTARRAQVAISYNAVPAKMAIRIFGPNGWLDWQALTNASDLDKYLLKAGGTLTGKLTSRTKESVPLAFVRSDKGNSDRDWTHDLNFETSDGVRTVVIRSQINAVGNRVLTLGVSNAENVAPVGIEIIRDEQNNSVFAKAPSNNYPGTKQICNTYAGTTPLTAGSSAMDNNCVYQVYE